MPSSIWIRNSCTACSPAAVRSMANGVFPSNRFFGPGQPLFTVVAISINPSRQFVNPRHPGQPIRLVHAQWFLALPPVLQGARWNDHLRSVPSEKSRSKRQIPPARRVALPARPPSSQTEMAGETGLAAAAHKDIMPQNSRQIVPAYRPQPSHEPDFAGCPRSRF